MEELGQKLSIIDNFTQPLTDFANRMAESASRMAEMGNIGANLTTKIEGLEDRAKATTSVWDSFSERLQATKMPIEQINSARDDLERLAETSTIGANKIANAYEDMANHGVQHVGDMTKALEKLASTASDPEKAMDSLTNLVIDSSEKSTVSWGSFNSALKDTPELASRIANVMNTSTEDVIDDLRKGRTEAERFNETLKRAGSVGGGIPPRGGRFGGGESEGGGRFGGALAGGMLGGNGRGMFRSILGANLVTSGIMGAFNMARNGISSLREEMDDSSKAWQTFQGNMNEIHMPQAQIDATRDALQNYAQATIYDSSDMASTFSQFASVGTKNAQAVVTGFGGIAAAAENPKQAMKTLSQQGTQMASKPMVQWQDFRLMLEQTPAGIAGVAKTMHESTGQLVRDVQNGTVKTQDFLDAVAKTGNSKQFTQMATHYKTVGEAIDGTRETLANKFEPEWQNMSGVVIDAISKVNDAIGDMNVSGLGDKLKPYILGGVDGTIKFFQTATRDVKAFFGAFADTGAVKNAGSIISDVGGIINKIIDSSGKKHDPLSGIKSLGTFAGGVINGLVKLANAVNSLSPSTLKELGTAFLLINLSTRGLVLSGIVSGLYLISKLSPGTLKAVAVGIVAVASAMALFRVVRGISSAFNSTKNFLGMFSGNSGSLGTASKNIGKTAVQFLELGGAMLLFGGGVMLAGMGIMQMANASVTLANAGWPAVAVMFGMIGAIGLLGYVVSSIGGGMIGGAVGFLILGVALIAVGYGVKLLADSAVELANAGWPAIAVMFGIIVVVTLLAVVVSVLGVAMLVGSIGFLAFGVAMLVIGAGIWLIADGFSLVLGQLSNVAQYGIQASIAMLALAGGMFVLALGMVLAGVGSIVLGAGLAVLGVGAIVGAVGLGLLAVAGLAVAVAIVAIGVALMVASAGIIALKKALSGHFIQAKNAISDVKGSISGLSSAVSSETSKAFGGVTAHADSTADHINNKNISPNIDTKDATNKLQTLNNTKVNPKMGQMDMSNFKMPDLSKVSGANGLQMPNMNMNNLGGSSQTIKAPKVETPKVPKPTMPKNIGTIKAPKVETPKVPKPNTSGMVGAVKTGVHNAVTVVKNAHSNFYTAGSYLSQGLANGMRSALSEVTDTANELVAQADRAVRAKARIHSPSRLFAELGNYIGQGMAVGMNNSRGYVEDASGNLNDSAQSGISDINMGTTYSKRRGYNAYTSGGHTTNSSSTDNSIVIEKGAVHVENYGQEPDYDTLLGGIEDVIVKKQRGMLTNA